MILFSHFPEYRFVIPGQAISFRSHKAKKYKQLVRRIAKDVLPKRLIGQFIEVHMDYFHSRPRRLDMDNVAKCVLDALNGVAYVDDKQVRVQSAKAYLLRSPVEIWGGPVDLIKPLSKYEEYVFIRVRSPRARKRRRIPLKHGSL